MTGRDDGKAYSPPFSLLTTSCVLFDAVAVADGAHAVDWLADVDAVEFVKDDAAKAAVATAEAAKSALDAMALAETSAAKTADAAKLAALSTLADVAGAEAETAMADLAEAEAHDRYRAAS